MTWNKELIFYRFVNTHFNMQRFLTTMKYLGERFKGQLSRATGYLRVLTGTYGQFGEKCQAINGSSNPCRHTHSYTQTQTHTHTHSTWRERETETESEREGGREGAGAEGSAQRRTRTEWY